MYFENKLAGFGVNPDDEYIGPTSEEGSLNPVTQSSIESRESKISVPSLQMP